MYVPTAYYIQVSKSVGFLHFTFTLELFTDQQSNFLQYAHNFEWCRRPVKNNKKKCTKWNLCLRITYSMQKRQLNLMEDFFCGHHPSFPAQFLAKWFIFVLQSRKSAENFFLFWLDSSEMLCIFTHQY